MANYLYLAEKYFESKEVLSAAQKEEFLKTYVNWREKCIDVNRKKKEKQTHNKKNIRKHFWKFKY